VNALGAGNTTTVSAVVAGTTAGTNSAWHAGAFRREYNHRCSHDRNSTNTGTSVSGGIIRLTPAAA